MPPYKAKCKIYPCGGVVNKDVLYDYFGHSTKMDEHIDIYTTTIETKFGKKKFNPIIASRDRLIIPRHIVHQWFNQNIITDIDIRIDEGKDLIIKKHNIKLMPHQKAVQSMVISKYFNTDMVSQGRAGCMIKLGTGLGKTHLGSSIMRILGVKTAIIVPNIKLATQWEDRFRGVFPDLKIGIYKTGKRIWGDVIIMVGKSVLSDKYTFTHYTHNRTKTKLKEPLVFNQKDFWNKFGLTIYDEAHMYCSDIYRNIFVISARLRMLGLSATPEYAKYSKLLDYYIGETIDGDAMEEVSSQIIDFKKIYTPIFYTPPSGYGLIKDEDDEEKLLWSNTISNILTDPYRLQLVIDIVKDLYDNGENIFVFTDRKQIFPIYKQALKEIGMKRIYTMTADTTEDEQTMMEKKARVILATYQAGGTGLSVDHMTSMVFATPRKQKFKQIIGRILRIKSDSSHPRTIVDIVDQAIFFQYRHRKQAMVDEFKAKLKNSQKIKYNEIDIECDDKLDFDYV